MDPIKEGKAYSSFQRFINEAEEDAELEDEMREDNPEELDDDELEDEDYQYPNLGDDDENELESQAYATASNNTMSDLRQIEDKLRSFEEGGNFDEDEDFGANPMDDSPFGKVPDWVKDLNKSNTDQY
jgi:hypothetical protein